MRGSERVSTSVPPRSQDPTSGGNSSLPRGLYAALFLGMKLINFDRSIGSMHAATWDLEPCRERGVPKSFFPVIFPLSHLHHEDSLYRLLLVAWETAVLFIYYSRLLLSSTMATNPAVIPKPDDYNEPFGAYNGRRLVIAASVGVGLSTIWVALRIWTRRYVTQALGTDDYLMAAAWVWF